jgi:hypothetical protein
MSTAMHAAPHATYIAKLVQMHRCGKYVDDCAVPTCLTCDNVQQPGKVVEPLGYLFSSSEHFLENAPMLPVQGCEVL